MEEKRVRDREDRTSAALMTGALLVAVAAGMAVAYLGLFVMDAVWPTAASGLVLVSIAYVCRDRRWITTLFLGSGLSILLTWTVVWGGRFLVSHF